MNRFSTEEACRRYVAHVRWGDTPTCPRCGATTLWRIRRGVFRCRTCRRDISITAGTIFGDSRIPLRLWFQAVWLIVSQKNGMSALGVSRALGIARQKTGWYLLRRIRTAMVRIGRERLSGVVEVDEVYLGGVTTGRGGRSAFGRVLALIAVEDKGCVFGRIRIRSIPDASFGSLSTALASMVEPGSVVRTDEWQGYSGLAKKGYRHRVMRKQARELGADPTPLVHRVASLLKRWLLGTFQGGAQTKNLQAYFDEFVFRFNRRTSRSRGKLFYRLVQNMVQAQK